MQRKKFAPHLSFVLSKEVADGRGDRELVRLRRGAARVLSHA